MVKIKKTPVFRKVITALSLIFCLALGAWLYWLYGWLADYEESQPKYVAEATYERYFSDFDAKEYVRLCDLGEDSIENTENVIAYLNSVTKDRDITYNKVASGLEGGIKYIVVAGDGEDEVKFASFTLTEKNGGKFKKYEAGSYELYLDSKHTVTVEAPKGYQVLVNGKELSDKYIVENDIPTDSCNHMPEGVSGTYYTRYSVKTLNSEIELKILSADKNEAVFNNTDGVYRAELVNNGSLSEEYSEWVLEAAELYARYTQYDENVNVVTFKKVAPYFDPESELYESIRTMDNMFVEYYDSFEFTDKTASEFVKYDDNTFSCRVELKQIMYSGNDVYDDYIDQTFYLRRVDDKFLIYDMQVNVD